MLDNVCFMSRGFVVGDCNMGRFYLKLKAQCKGNDKINRLISMEGIY